MTCETVSADCDYCLLSMIRSLRFPIEIRKCKLSQTHRTESQSVNYMDYSIASFVIIRHICAPSQLLSDSHLATITASSAAASWIFISYIL